MNTLRELKDYFFGDVFVHWDDVTVCSMGGVNRRCLPAVDVQELGGQTGTTGYNDTSATPSSANTVSQEGIGERTLGNANNALEGNARLDTNQSGTVGDHDPRNN